MMLLVGIFIIGLIVGSFLNVLISRLPNVKSILSGHSQCPKCHHQLKWYDLIPIISYVQLGGKCRYCQKKISIQYPFVELITALLFIVIYYQFGISSYSILLLLLTCSLIVIFVFDQINQIIPDEMLICAFLLTLVYYLAKYKFYDLNSIILGVVIPVLLVGLIVFFTKGKGMGIGDIKLAGLLGFILGYPEIIVALFLAFVIGSIYGLILVTGGKKSMKDTVAFGPFLIIGFYISLFYGQEILNWYFKI